MVLAQVCYSCGLGLGKRSLNYINIAIETHVYVSCEFYRTIIAYAHSKQKQNFAHTKIGAITTPISFSSPTYSFLPIPFLREPSLAYTLALLKEFEDAPEA